jgi:hypothetical protein
MLSEICDAFATEVEALDPKDEDHPTDLRVLVLKLVRDAATHFAEYQYGEVSALIELARLVLAWISAEAEDADRSRRYGRERALLDLLVLCEGVRVFHTGSKRKAADVDAFRVQIGDALRGLMPE